MRIPARRRPYFDAGNAGPRSTERVASTIAINAPLNIM
ncbi:hypothetical protein DVU_3341 [Nitratidesulfovibrio vulgaris str. Hildenborough]|uniref:Uncharacterized protein n=1 Tax=Nitratidesulfovibrio vulgaris (strain ATCC 29579 / DSM 644 / CCUG 34227 / NCIMB 8303 / VKM B-1760 / Hildenborough) TaxID=882 RepID=Q725T3_NITV2|nr:hypothetical protein DVU_3341 [Nitratidesulfovibrio vulgaris str. Hildenborough]